MCVLWAYKNWKGFAWWTYLFVLWYLVVRAAFSHEDLNSNWPHRKWKHFLLHSFSSVENPWLDEIKIYYSSPFSYFMWNHQKSNCRLKKIIGFRLRFVLIYFWLNWQYLLMYDDVSFPFFFSVIDMILMINHGTHYM